MDEMEIMELMEFVVKMVSLDLLVLKGKKVCMVLEDHPVDEV